MADALIVSIIDVSILNIVIESTIITSGISPVNDPLVFKVFGIALWNSRYLELHCGIQGIWNCTLELKVFGIAYTSYGSRCT